MNSNPILACITIENACKISTLIDKGYECYAAIDETLAKSLGLPTIKKFSQRLQGAIKDIKELGIQGVVTLGLEMNSFP